MKFVAEKPPDKKKVILTDGYYLVEKTKYRNTTQTAFAWKKRKDELRKDGWEIHVIDITIPTEADAKICEEKPKEKKGVLKAIKHFFADEEL